MAILLPVLIGSFDLGRAYFAYGALAHAVNEGGRYGSFDSDTNNIVSAVQTAGGGLNLQTSDVTVACYSGSSSTTKTCTSMVIGDSVRITATKSFIPATPWLNRLLPGGSITLWAVAQRTYQ